MPGGKRIMPGLEFRNLMQELRDKVQSTFPEESAPKCRGFRISK